MKRIPVTSPASVAVFRRILSHGPIGRTEIARDTGLSAGAVTKAVTPLMHAGYVVEAPADPAHTSTGRPVRPLAVATDKTHVIGIKMTGDHVYGVLTDLAANVLAQTEEERPSAEVADAVRTVTNVVDHLRSRTSATIAGVGVAVGGFVDREAGVVREYALLGWRDVPLASLIEQEIGLPTVVENSVRALAINESLFGAGRDRRGFAVVTIGRGIGSGAVIEGQLLRGDHGVAGEIGHLPLADAGIACLCGKFGCVEAVASTSAIRARVRSEHQNPALTVEDCIRMAREGDGSAIRAFAEAGAVIGKAIAVLVDVLGSSRVVIAGESITAYELYEKELISAFEHHVVGDPEDRIVALPAHTYFDWARGAAACVVEVVASGT